MSYVLQMLGRDLISDFGEFFGEDLLQPADSAGTEKLQQQIHRYPDSPDLHLEIGLLYLRQISLGKAIEHLITALRLKPDYLQVRLALIWAYTKLGNDDLAIEQLHNALDAYGSNPKLCFALAFCHERAGDVNAAMNHYQKVLQLDQAYSAARSRLAAIFLRLNQCDRAIEQYEIIRTDKPGSVFVLIALGNLYLHTGQSCLAMSMFERALLIEPDNWQASDELADALDQAGLYADAIGHVAKLIAEQPEFADLHLRIAGLYAKDGQDHKAIEHFHHALGIHPNFLEAAVRLGAHHLRMNRFFEAAKWFARAVEINDQLLLAYVGLGLAQSQMGQADKAQQSFDMAASIEPNTTLLFAEMARLHLKDIMLNHQPDCPLAAQPASFDQQNRREPSDNLLLDQQIAAHASHLAAHPNSADSHYRYGLLLQARQRCDQAIDQYRQALAINPSYLKAQIKLALALRRKGQTSQATKLLNGTFRIDPQALELHYRLALIYSDQSKFTLALEQHQTTLDGSAQHVDLSMNLSLALQNMYLLDPVAISFNAMRQISADPAIISTAH